jgi:hypothetical protein
MKDLHGIKQHRSREFLPASARGVTKPLPTSIGYLFYVITHRQDLAALFIRDRNVGHKAFDQRRFPNLFLGWKGTPNLMLAFKKSAYMGHLLIKTPPVTGVADGAFEMIFSVDFSLVVSLQQSTP